MMGNATADGCEREQLYCGYKGCLPGRGLVSLAHLPGRSLETIANCATYSNCLCATVLILCKPTNDSQVSRVAATECGKCDKVRRSTGTSATLDRNHPPTPVAQPPFNEPACRLL